MLSDDEEDVKKPVAKTSFGVNSGTATKTTSVTNVPVIAPQIIKKETKNIWDEEEDDE